MKGVRKINKPENSHFYRLLLYFCTFLVDNCSKNVFWKWPMNDPLKTTATHQLRTSGLDIPKKIYQLNKQYSKSDYFCLPLLLLSHCCYER